MLKNKSRLITLLMLFALCSYLPVRIARTTYLNRIVDTPDDLAETLSMGLTLAYAVSMLVPLGGGLLWAHYGYMSVFLVAAALAIVNLWLATFIPEQDPVQSLQV